jgi:hypothetical protein
MSKRPYWQGHSERNRSGALAQDRCSRRIPATGEHFGNARASGFGQGCFDFACSAAATEETALSKTLMRREFDRKDMKDVKHFQP